ncbi:2-phospho-L-lactate guanylyltransferase [Candidatus Bathyarchaeota archaeon B24-2]|nr:MAG: 2-phospho-L-lactate guanylyltransferase [Candidatus Bathyarchaeota archaeon B24-2]
MRVAAIIPVKRLKDAKSRLSNLMSEEERVNLTLIMLTDVLKSIKESSVDEIIVVSSNAEVCKVAERYSAKFLKETSLGLRNAVAQASSWCTAQGIECTLFIPADVPLITREDINAIISLCKHERQVVISPSKSGGTNALLRRPIDVIPTFFGMGSFRKHLEYLIKRRVNYEVYISPRIILDVDSPEDLYEVSRIVNSSATKRYLEEIRILDRIKRNRL